MDKKIRRLNEEIKHLFDDSSVAGADHIPELNHLLAKLTEIDPTTLKLIDHKIKGFFGSEYLLGNIDNGVAEQFYSGLTQMFPQSLDVAMSYADVLALEGKYTEAFSVYFETFARDYMRVFEMPSELPEILQERGSAEQNIRYLLYLMQAVIAEDDLEEARFLYQDLMNRYGAFTTLPKIIDADSSTFLR